MNKTALITAGFLLAAQGVALADWQTTTIQDTMLNVGCGRDNSISFDGVYVTVIYTCGTVIKVARGAPPSSRGWSPTISTLGTFVVPTAVGRAPVKALKNGTVLFIANGSTLIHAKPTVANAGNCGTNLEWACDTVGSAVEFDAELQSNGFPLVYAMQSLTTLVNYSGQTNGSWTATSLYVPDLNVFGRCVAVVGQYTHQGENRSVGSWGIPSYFLDGSNLADGSYAPCTFDTATGTSMVHGGHRYVWSESKNAWVVTEYYPGTDDNLRKGYATRSNGTYYMISRGGSAGLVLYYNGMTAGPAPFYLKLTDFTVVVGNAVPVGTTSVAANPAASTFYVSYHETNSSAVRLAYFVP